MRWPRSTCRRGRCSGTSSSSSGAGPSGSRSPGRSNDENHAGGRFRFRPRSRGADRAARPARDAAERPRQLELAGTAKVLCSALFVSGRDSAEARAHVARLLPRRKARLDHGVPGRPAPQARPADARRAASPARPSSTATRAASSTNPARDTRLLHAGAGDLARCPTPPRRRGRWAISSQPRRSPPGSTPPSSGRPPTPPSPIPKGSPPASSWCTRAGSWPSGTRNGANRDMQLESWSMGKSITGTLIGMLVQQGAFKLEDPAPVPEWRKMPGDPRAKIRIMDLMRMSSGLRFSRGSPEDIPGYHDHDLIYTGAIDAFQFAVTREPQFEPNTFGRYRNVDVMTLGLLDPRRGPQAGRGVSHVAAARAVRQDRHPPPGAGDGPLRQLPALRVRLRHRAQLGAARHAVPERRHVERGAAAARRVDEVRVDAGAGVGRLELRRDGLGQRARGRGRCRATHSRSAARGGRRRTSFRRSIS